MAIKHNTAGKGKNKTSSQDTSSKTTTAVTIPAVQQSMKK